MKQKNILLFVATATLLLLACGDDNGPTGSSPVTYTPPQQIASIPPPPPTTNNPPANPTPTPTELPYRGDWVDAPAGRVAANLENNSNETQWLGLACYAGVQSDPDQQYLPEPRRKYYQIKEIKAGKHFRFEVKEPCGPYQCDAFWGLDEPREPPWYDDYLLFGKHRTGRTDCEPPRETPPENPCVPDPIRDFKVSQKIGPESVIVTVSYEINGKGKIIWGDGSTTEVNGSGFREHEYIRLTESQEFTITMETFCDPVSASVTIPALPELTCEDVTMSLSIDMDQDMATANWSVGPLPTMRIDLDWGDGNSLDQPVPPGGSAQHKYDCPREGGVGVYTATLMVTSDDLVCSETTLVEVECEIECEEAQVDVDYREKNCTLGTVKYLATANMKGRFCVSGGGLAQTFPPEAQTTLGNPLFSLTPGNCVDDVDNVWIKVPESSEFTVSFAGNDACEEWEDTIQAEECEEPQECSTEWDKSSYSASGSCSAQVCNTGDGPGLCPVEWELYYNADGPAKNGSVVNGGSLDPLGHGCESISAPDTPPGNYQFKFYQHSGHPGSGELWADQCSK